MLKIKDDVNLKELEKFGFYVDGNSYKYNLPLGKCAYVCCVSKIKELVFPCYNLKWYQFLFRKKIIREINKIQLKLFQAGIVEKV